MNDQSLPNSSSSQNGFHIRSLEWHFDLARAQRDRIKKQTETLDLHEYRKRRIHKVTQQIGQLIQEYRETARRVGTKMNQGLLSTVVETLKKAPSEDQDPLGDMPGVSAVEKFLAESLYREILEVSRTPRKDTPLLAAGEWQDCLEILSHFIEK